MLRIDNIKIPVDTEDQEKAIIKKCAKLLGVTGKNITGFRILRQSIDARKKPDVFYQYQVAVELEKGIKPKRKANINPLKENKYKLPEATQFNKPPVVAGFGPAGIFAAYILALSGANPIVLERGKEAEARVRDVDLFHKSGELNEKSNVQFGEGGAGTFSDGKLNTQKNDRFGRNSFVLETFVKFGADERILYEAKPHIGTDRLIDIIANIRKEIIRLGGQVRFLSPLEEISYENHRLLGLYSNGEFIESDNLVLAIGHSARDTFEYLVSTDLEITAKPFAVGFRAEHPQDFISKIQYGAAAQYLPAADYKLVTKHTPRTVYSFCMCPGGYVIDSSSEKGLLCVNGMSESGRDSKNANSAIVVGVSEKEFDINDPLGGMKYQRELEKKAYSLANGKIPQQLFADFVEGRPSRSYGEFESLTKGEHSLCNFRGLLGNELEENLINGIKEADRYIPGFARDDLILSGIESRTSSPVRIPRDESFQSESIRGIYPCGEGAGYAGGIMSAAMDGIKVAEKIIANNEKQVIQ